MVRWDGERGARAVDRLRRVAREAAAQCRRAWLPEVSAVSDLDRLASLTGGPRAWPSRAARPRAWTGRWWRSGPRAGWDPDELAASARARWASGPTVLRAETAAVAAGTLLCALRSGLVATPCVTTLREAKLHREAGTPSRSERPLGPRCGARGRCQSCTCVTLAEPELEGRSVEMSGGAA